MNNFLLNSTVNLKEKYHMPFFGIPEGATREEMQRRLKGLKDAGIESFIGGVRSSEYMGWAYWKDMDIMIEECRKLGMSFWIQDEQFFPTGEANGWVKHRRPDLGKEFIKTRHLDAVGPLNGASFSVDYWLNPNNLNDVRSYLVDLPVEGSDKGFWETLRNVPKLDKQNELIQVVAYKKDGENGSISGSPIDLTDQVREGFVFWDVPEGFWRIFIIMKTYYSTGRRIYINVINRESVRLLIDALYEPMYDRYAKYFGNTFRGFFTDEPEFGNYAGYGLNKSTGIGKQDFPLPWCDEMREAMETSLGEDYLLYLPALWHNAGSAQNARVRYAYMDNATKLYRKNFTEQIGEWCKEHGCLYTGHIHEDGDNHARLGSGVGHFFRSMAGQDIAGIDFVYDQLLPGFDSVDYAWSYGNWDGEEFVYGISKLGSSLAHIDPRKKGRVLCEAYGAYESVHGLRHMKWVCDHLLSRGINYMMPNFVSTFGRRPNPQYKHFGVLTNYLSRACSLLNGGIHSAPVAVLYHGEAEWSGEYMNSARPIKKLAQAQIDCDIIPADVFSDREYFKTFLNGSKLYINEEEYEALIIPYCEFIPSTVARFISETHEAGFPVIFVDNLPVGIVDASGAEEQELLDSISRCRTVALEETGKIVRDLGIFHIEASPAEESLRYYRYRNNGYTIYMLFNENAYKPIDVNVAFPETGEFVVYDALLDRFTKPESANSDKTVINVKLAPYESYMVLFGDCNDLEVSPERKFATKTVLNGKWKLAACKAEHYPDFDEPEELDKLKNLGVPGGFQTFCGVFGYTTEFTLSDIPKMATLDLGSVYETAQVWINGKDAGTRICPPYIFELDGLVKKGVNTLYIEITGTNRSGDSPTSMYEPLGLLGEVALLTE